MPGLPRNPRFIPPSDSAVHRISTTAEGRLLRHSYVARLVFCCAHHYGFGECRRASSVSLSSASSAQRLTGATVAPPSHPGDGRPRVSLREGARRAGSSSLRRRPLPCPGPALLAVAHLLLPVRRYARTWSWCLSCSRVLRSMRWRRTFRTVASHLPVFFFYWESFQAGTQ